MYRARGTDKNINQDLIVYDNFKIFNTYNSKYSLVIAESLYIKQICPNLKSDAS